MEPISIESYQNDPDVSLRMQEQARRERAKFIGDCVAQLFAQLRERFDRVGHRLSARLDRVRVPALRMSHWG